MFIYLKYYILTVTCVLYTIQSVNSANCPGDCIDMFLCPAGVDYLNNKIDESLKFFLRNTQCGVSDKDHPLICCSMLDRNINNHPNLKLLPEACGLIGGDRIYGGQETGLYEFPWMSLISHNTRDGLSFKCGGTIINNRYILTAAHCVQGYQIAGVRIGEHNIDSETDCEGVPPKIVCESKLQDIRVEEEIPHESFQRLPYLQNDIALLRLKKPIDFKPKNARPVCLPVTSELINRNTAGVNGTVAGWGHREHTVFSNVLLAVRVPIYSKTDCSETYNRGNKLGELTLNKLCAGELGKDSCKGDSGGPLMIEGTHGGVKRFIQHGIVSHGPGQCGSSYPGIYTDVTKYMDWILDHIKP